MKAILEIILYVVLLSYLTAALLYFRGAGRDRLRQAALAPAWLGWVLHLAALAIRTVFTGRLPLTDGVEFLLCFTWITVLLYLIFALRQQNDAAGGVVMLIAAILVALVAFLLQEQLGMAAPLMPALKSPWLAAHVITAAVAYAAFTLAAGLAAMQFFRADHSITDDNVYLMVGGGFALLSLSIVLGAIWAEQAWGKYWTWDPKETWALVTWIIYAIYLHLHRSREWRGNNARLMVIGGFILVLFTFFGVNYLLPGLHSYA